MNSVDKLPMRVLSKRVSEITKRYRTAQIREKLSQAETISLTQGDETTKSQHRHYIEAFEMALNMLLPHHRTIIFNDYVNQQFLFWWEVEYARSTYYRHKYKALQQFASYFYS